MLTDITPQQKELAALMSIISEKGYAAQWITGLEYQLWDIIQIGHGQIGRHNLTTSEIELMKQRSIMSNCWIYFDDSKGETAITLADWQDKFERTTG